MTNVVKTLLTCHYLKMCQCLFCFTVNGKEAFSFLSYSMETLLFVTVSRVSVCLNAVGVDDLLQLFSRSVI